MKVKEYNQEAQSLIKKYDSEEVYELIHVANCFQELREKAKTKKINT